MYRIAALLVVLLLGGPSLAPAQTVIRAPFVRVQVGGGVDVRAPFVHVNVGGGVAVQAPFVNLYLPGRPRVYCPPPGTLPAPDAPGQETLPPPTRMPEKADPPSPQPPTSAPGAGPSALGAGLLTPPSPQPAAPLTLDAFARTFQPREGSHEVVLQNPVTGAPATVRFSLPAGSPSRVTVTRRQVAFVYDGGQRVRIAFDRRGARVTSQ
jgi:hypothetical protein